MIIWIASYPKSGNTWLRTLISSYYYSKDGTFHSDLIQQIGQFPEKRHFESFNYDNKSVIGTTCLLYTSPSPRDLYRSRMPSSA